MAKCWQFVFIAIWTLASAQEAVNSKPGDSATHHRPLESHHSLHHPFDTSVAYWQYGGSTVATGRLVRLTPSAQSRTGWLWNEYPLAQKDWEIEVMFETKSDYHLGGDGFGVWILKNTMDPKNTETSNSLTGSVFGLREDFDGFGVAFDTYDNDGERDNPLIYVLKNDGSRRDWDAGGDYKADRNVEIVPIGEDVVGSYECTSDYRNVKSPVRVIFRYRDQDLHVYVDDNGSGEYKFCLAVKVGIDTTDAYHIAFSAMTGDVADAHDILGVSTRYIDDKDARIGDARLAALGYTQNRGVWGHMAFWFIHASLASLLLVEVYNEISLFGRLKKGGMNPVYLCSKLNPNLIVSYWVFFLQLGLLAIFFKFYALLCNVPLALIRIPLFLKKRHKLESAALDKPVLLGLKYPTFLYLQFVLILIPWLYYVINLVW